MTPRPPEVTGDGDGAAQGRPGVATFWTHDPSAPSFRHRLAPVVPALSDLGWACEQVVLPNGEYVRRFVARRALLARSSLLVLAKIKLSPLESWILRRGAGRIAFDFDDAIYYRRPRRIGEEPDRSWWRRKKFEHTCRMVDLVVAGNPVLAERAQGHAKRVEIVPTPVDAEAYARASQTPRCGRTLVWIGLPENLGYLELIRPALAELSREFPDLRLRVVCSSFPDWSDVAIEPVVWSPEVEVASIATADIGLMPLTDDDWTRGKCAFKLLQYMAAGLPCVASSVGVNTSVVRHGVTGFLASTPDEWTEALRRLLDSLERRTAFGARGHEDVLEHYDRRRVAARTASLLDELGRRGAFSAPGA